MTEQILTGMIVFAYLPKDHYHILNMKYTITYFWNYRFHFGINNKPWDRNTGPCTTANSCSFVSWGTLYRTIGIQKPLSHSNIPAALINER